MMADVRRWMRNISMETRSLPLFSTFALLTIVAGQLQGSGYKEPEFLSPLENLTVAQGRDIHFTCTVNHLGSYKVAWIKSDTKAIIAIHTHMVTLNSRLSVTHNGHNTWKLYINNVEPEDSGSYMCQINTDPMKNQMGHLKVVISPDIADDYWSEASAIEGGSVELRCTATGEPPPTISWKRTAGRPIVFRDDNGKKYKEVENYVGTTISLRGVQRTDMGTYLCIAANGIPPTKSRRYEVAVKFKPTVRVVNPIVLRSIEMQVTLLCDVEASPKSLNTWHRNKSSTGWKLLNDSKYIIISEEVRNEYMLRMNLTITRLKKEDFGEYTCNATNGYGEAEGSITLKEAPQKTTTTTTTTTTTSTTTTPRPTTPRPTTTRPRKQPKKQYDRGMLHNVIDPDVRQAELNNALNLYTNPLGSSANTTYNEYSQRTEKQKVRPSGPPRLYTVYNASDALFKAVTLFYVIAVTLLKILT